MSPLLPSPVPGLLGAGFPPGDAAQKAPGSPSAPSGCCINRACNYPAPLRTPSRPPGLCFVLNSGTPGSAGSPPAALPQPLPSRTGSTGGGPKPGAGGAARCWLTGNRAGRSAAPQTKECSARLGSARLSPAPPAAAGTGAGAAPRGSPGAGCRRDAPSQSRSRSRSRPRPPGHSVDGNGELRPGARCHGNS